MLPFGNTGYMGSLNYFLEPHVNSYIKTKCFISSIKKFIKYNHHLNYLEITLRLCNNWRNIYSKKSMKSRLEE